MDFAESTDYKGKMQEGEKLNKYMDLARELAHDGDSATEHSCSTGNSHQSMEIKLEE